MQVSVEDAGSLTKKVTVVVPAKTVTKKLDKSYNKLKSDVSIKGFRKGKVPFKVLEKNYGEQVKAEVGEKLVQDTYFDAIEQSGLNVVVHPDIKSHSFTDEGTFEYVAEVAVKPEFELGEYNGIKVELPELTVTEEETDHALQALRKEMAPLKSVDDRSVQVGDVAVVDFQGFHENEPVKEIQGQNYSVDIGSGVNGKEFEDACLGLKKGEETSKVVPFPASFPNPVLSGKEIEFKITVKDIKERVLADLDDEFAKDVGEFDSLDALKTNIVEKITREKEEGRKGEFTDKLMMQILENHEFEVPDRLVAYEVSEQIKQLEQRLKQQGLTLESAGISQSQLIEDYQEASAKRVKGDFIIKKIAEVEKVKLEDEDIKGGFNRIAAQYNMPVEEVRKYFGNRDDLLPFMNELLNEKVLDFLRNKAEIIEVPIEAEAAEAAAAESTGENA
ncbi:MAG: trigger factor [Desulfobulbaceae bacterium]|uniref:Trigger factor n=1 Tax=Candidatus Desulfobia pelagia TaxID=2841692 RepID=A0A8J6NFA0_9BACT|nr:trigger factor [Candidatus Desulfobia pelagia]